MILFFFFFFQAEDGIRDLYVTGVQTCALPICRHPGRRNVRRRRRRALGCTGRLGLGSRSEEHTSELQSRRDLVCRLLLEKKKKKIRHIYFLNKKKKKKKKLETIYTL